MSPDAGFPREPSLPFLVHRIARRIDHLVNAKAKPYGLKVESIRILVRLGSHDRQSVGDLAEATSIEQSALSHMLKRLERDRYVSRSTPEHDSRSVIIGLTSKGRKMAQRFAPIFHDYDEKSTSGFSPDQRSRVKADLLRIHDNLAS